MTFIAIVNEWTDGPHSIETLHILAVTLRHLLARCELYLTGFLCICSRCMESAIACKELFYVIIFGLYATDGAHVDSPKTDGGSDQH